MDNANVLKKCCYRSLKENRKRTVVTIVGVILATALITGVACIAVSFRASMIAYEKQQDGDFHYHFVNVRQEYLKYFENNNYIEKYSLVQALGYAMLEESVNPDKPYLYVSAIEEGMESTLALTLVEGRMPENSTELVVGRHVRSNGGVEISVGDTLTLHMGERVSEGYSLGQKNSYIGEEEVLELFTEKQYTVVGIIERPNTEVEPRTAPGYSAFTRLENPGEAETVDVYASYTKEGLRHAEQVNAGILGVEEELYRRYYVNLGPITWEEQERIQTVAENVQENYWLLKWELMIFSSNSMNIMYAMSAVAIAIIIVTSVFCIRNSFMISLTEKMKLYGRLASVGTTSRQQRKIVYYEAMVLGAVGIPLGVISGIAATAILLKAVGGLVEEGMGFELVFGTSVPAILLGAALSAVTVYFSAAGSARRAARISPVSAIRVNDMVKTEWGVFGKETSGKNLRCPAFVNRIFGIGGKIAYKSLRRARVKYRTTVISIVVSVAVFIGMSTFVELLMLASSVYYEDMPYQLAVDIYQWKYYDQALEIAGMEGVQEAEIIRSYRFPVDSSEITYSEEYLERFEGMKKTTILVCSLGKEAYARYCRKVGVSVEEAKDKGIVVADYSLQTWDEGQLLYITEGDITSLHRGEILKGTDAAAGLEIEVLTQTRVKPMYMSAGNANQIVVIVSDEWMDTQVPEEARNTGNIKVCVKCGNADEIEEAIRNNMSLAYFTVTNYNAQYRANHSMYLTVAIFLYGFIIVVALIGITNIFNTVTTNMELRAPEFAMLRSVGMTRGEFRRMIWLEGVFYGGKALVIGIPLGLVLSVCFHRALGEGIVTDFRFPWAGMGSAVLAVALLLYVTMRYSMSRINRKNIIETIRNENI